ncbi:hypothetical protein [Lysobacter gummosus]|uniref:hypothetical protein n=1 Tax=Lysobacter gummosus TaxID=262324 RepID=UPI003631C759
MRSPSQHRKIPACIARAPVGLEPKASQEFYRCPPLRSPGWRRRVSRWPCCPCACSPWPPTPTTRPTPAPRSTNSTRSRSAASPLPSSAPSAVPARPRPTPR